MAKIDDIFHDFAAAFTGAVGDAKPIGFPHKLRREALDLSLGSLKQVDIYLSYLHQQQMQLSDQEWQTTVLYSGAYVGEVIRSETNNAYHWIDYNDYMPTHPELQAIIPERSTPTCAFLVNDKGVMSMPLNKVRAPLMKV
ncbi:MAG: hypothetical protein HC768_19295 [Acaryochloris sp. CRU_2_0]|nr:hypothetical protein [Acaryochloris sp. CRU_2_0]